MFRKLLLYVAVCLLFPLITYSQAPVTPPDASTGVSQATPAVTWTDFDDGFGNGPYDAEFDDDPAFGSVDASVAATPVTLLALPALSYNTAYYWRVRDTDIDGGGTDGPWHAYSFTTEIATPVLTAPANGAPGQPTSVNLTWTLAGGSGGVTFDLEYHTGGGFPGTTVAGVSSPYAFGGLTNNTTYSWRIIAKKAGEADKTSSTFTFSTVPPAPTLTSPANYAVGVTVLPTLSWSGVGTSYDFEIDNNSDFSSPVATQSSAATSYAFTPYVSTATIVLSNSTLYYWRVRQTNANGTSGWASREFTTVSAATPQINISVLGTTAYITWYPLPYATGLKYDVYYSTASNMSGYSTAVSGTTGQYYSLSGLSAGTTYYVQIVSYTGSGPYVYYTFSSVSSFTTGGIPTIYPSYPTGGATAYSNPPTVYYYSGSYFSGLQYQVRYGTSSTDTTPADGEMDSGTNTALTSNLYTTLATLTAGTTYYWQVRGYDPVGATYGAWSSIESFVMYSTVPAAPIVPYPSYPIGGVTTYINPPTLYWYLGQYATGLEFYVQWDDAADFATPLGNSGWITNLYYTLTSSLADGTYYWRVKSRLAATLVESAYSTTESFVLSDPYSGATVPTPTYPIGGITVYTLSPTLGWYAYSTSTLEFEIKVAPYSNVDGNGMLNHATVTTYTWQTASTLGISGLSAGATYYWQVRSRLQATPATVSAWSSVVSFATAAGALSIVPQIADIVSPNHGQPINNTTALLSWKLQTQPESHLSYQVEYSKSEDFNNSVKVNGINEPFVKVENLDANSKYYWRINSSTNNITKPVYSSVGSFSTGGNVTDVEEENVIPNKYSLEQNYPNPFNPTTRITYSLPQNSFVALKIYDILGREVKTLINNEVNAGTHSIVWNGTDNYGNKVSSGTYIYRVVAGDFVSVKKMVLIK